MFTRFLNENDKVIGTASIVLYKNGFYFIDEFVEGSNKRIENIEGKDVLFIDSNNQTMSFEAIKLSKDEVYAFYEPVLPNLVIYVVIIFIKTLITIICGFVQAFSINKVINYLANEGRTRAFKNIEDAKRLSRLIIDIGKHNNIEVICILTNMDIPLGNNIGNALEVKEAIDTLCGKGPEDFVASFQDFSQDPFRPVLWLLAFLFLTHFVIVKGVKDGIEKSSKILMPVLF